MVARKKNPDAVQWTVKVGNRRVALSDWARDKDRKPAVVRAICRKRFGRPRELSSTELRKAFA